jgi:hypothetical protein
MDTDTEMETDMPATSNELTLSVVLEDTESMKQLLAPETEYLKGLSHEIEMG